MGYSVANFCIVRTIDGSTDVLQTFTHEVGHGVGQTGEKESRWDGPGNALSDENNPNWHTDPYGGRGPHCTTKRGAAPRARERGLTTGTVVPVRRGRSLVHDVFSGESHVEPDGKLCLPVCPV